jgi:DNA polymerase-3 subunit delta'
MEIEAGEFGRSLGHDAARNAFVSAMSSGRFHHGWLIRGPRGIGKARLALQMAIHLLGGGREGAFAAGPEDPVARRLVAGSHPDFRLIRQPVDDKGKMKAEIPVDSVRDLSQFFSLRAGMGGRRVVVIDALDQLNRFGANALLKPLEEPPPGGVLILLSHGERPILPTIISRCRVLSLKPLSEPHMREALVSNGASETDIAEMMRLAPGRPGRAMAFRGADVEAAGKATRAALRSINRLDAGALHAALTAAGKSDAALAVSLDILRRGLVRRASTEADPVLAGEFATLALELGRLEAEAMELHMDRAQTLSEAFGRIARLGHVTGAG